MPQKKNTGTAPRSLMGQSEDTLKAIIRAMGAATYASQVEGLMSAIEAVLLARDFTSPGFRDAVRRMDALIRAADTDIKIRAGLRYRHHH